MWQTSAGRGFINIDGSQQPANADKEGGKITTAVFLLLGQCIFKKQCML